MDSTAPSVPFKQALAVLPRSEPLSTALLQAHGINALRASALARSGWLVHLACSVCMLLGDTLTRDGCLALLGERTPGFHVGGRQRAGLAWDSSKRGLSRARQPMGRCTAESAHLVHPNASRPIARLPRCLIRPCPVASALRQCHLVTLECSSPCPSARCSKCSAMWASDSHCQRRAR